VQVSLDAASSSALFDELGQALGWRERTVLWMLYAYFDESGEKGPGGKLVRLTLGGGMAPFATWKALSQVWDAMLSTHHIAMFHTTRDKRYPDLMADAFKAVDQHMDISFLGCSIASQEGLDEFNDLYGAAVVNTLKAVYQTARIIGDPEVRLVFAVHEGFSITRIAKYVDLIRRALPVFEGWAAEPPRRCNPLQVADLAAHAVQCYYAGDDSIFQRLRQRHSFYVPS
jgi:hypothetical protein